MEGLVAVGVAPALWVGLGVGVDPAKQAVSGVLQIAVDVVRRAQQLVRSDVRAGVVRQKRLVGAAGFARRRAVAQPDIGEAVGLKGVSAADAPLMVPVRRLFVGCAVAVRIRYVVQFRVA